MRVPVMQVSLISALHKKEKCDLLKKT